MQSHRRLLVVDDEEDMLNLLRRVFNEAGYVVDTAANGREALHKLARNEYKLQLLDMRMPGMDGLEVLRTTKERHPTTATIMLTGYPSRESADAALSLGAEDYIVKPLNLDTLKRLVSKVLSRHEDPVEAVLISGPRKGQIVVLPTDAAVLTPAEEAAFDEAVANARQLADHAHAAVAAAESLRDELRYVRQEVSHEPA